MLQSVHEFKIKRKNHEFTFTVIEEVLNIVIICNDTYARYSTTIDQPYIKNNKNLDFFFGNTKDLYDYFLNSFEAIEFSNEGYLLFMLETNMGAVIRKYQCKVLLVKEEIQADKVLNLKVTGLSKEIQYLREENMKLKLKVAECQQEQQVLKKRVDDFEKMIMGKDEIINTIFHEIKQINKWKDDKEKMIEDIVTNKRKFIADEANPHNRKFTQIGNRFKKNGGGTWDVLFCKYPVEKNEVYKYNIKQIKAGSNGSFMYGVGTENLKGMNRAQDSKEFIGYYENTGNVYEQGESKKGGPKIKDGQTITIEIDTKRWKVFWFIEGKREAEANICAQLRNKNLHLTLVVYNDESEVQFV